jgi:hypothetical protein
MLHTILLLCHISGAVVALIAGAFAMIFRKGSGLHAVAGNVFVASMLVMTTSAAWIAAFIHPAPSNVVASSLAFYLVSTSWVTARRRNGGTGAVDIALLLVAATDGIASIAIGARLMRAGIMSRAGVPTVMFFVFGTVALLFAAGDVRMFMSGGVTGARRIARHLGRMSFAFLFALASFFPGQAKLFPRAWLSSIVFYIPHMLVLATTVYWLIRLRVRRRVRSNDSLQNVYGTKNARANAA